MINEEIIIINDEPFYRILNGTSYDYAPIPKEFKPYFERLQKENQKLKKELDILFIQHINYMDKQDFAKICHISRPYLDKLLKNDMTRTEIYEFCLTRNKILDKVKK